MLTTALTDMTMGTITDVGALLPLIWLASPALPVGGFSYSEGLEAAVSSGRVHDADSTRVWLNEQLWLTQARGDLSVLGAFMQAWREDAHETRHARVSAPNQWVQHTRDLQLCQQIGPTYPMVMGLALASTPADVRSALMAYAFGWAENMTQAAIKSVPLGQSAGQAILAALSQQIGLAVDEALSRDDDTRQSFSPMLAILCAQHETQYSRLFRS